MLISFRRLTGSRGLGLLMVILMVLLTGGGILCGWLWYDARYTRFPLHQLPRWEVFEGWRVARTQQYLREAEDALAKFHAQYGRLPFNRPKHEHQFSISLGHDLHAIHPDLRRLNRERVVFWSLPAGEQRDGWGNLFHYAFDHDGDGVVHPGDGHPGGTSVRRPFVVWSDGPDGNDDGGTGDDIPGW